MKTHMKINNDENIAKLILENSWSKKEQLRRLTHLWNLMYHGHKVYFPCFHIFLSFSSVKNLILNILWLIGLNCNLNIYLIPLYSFKWNIRYLWIPTWEYSYPIFNIDIDAMHLIFISWQWSWNWWAALRPLFPL